MLHTYGSWEFFSAAPTAQSAQNFISILRILLSNRLFQGLCKRPIIFLCQSNAIKWWHLVFYHFTSRCFLTLGFN